MKEKFQIWSCGGGVQSCAIAALIIQERLPRPFLSVIADTGRECQSTWDYLNEVINPALDKVDHCLRVIRVSAAEWGYYHNTGHEVFNAQGTLKIPIYTNESGQVAKFSGYCSSDWKQEPIDRWLRAQGVEKNQAVKWLGYGKDEQKRWARALTSKEYYLGLLRLPLVQDVPMNRHECQSLIKSMGWPKAPKSRCWMCPNQRDEEWLELTTEEFAAAVEFEREMQKRDPNAWLHKSCKPLDQVDFTRPSDLFSEMCQTGGCFT